MYICIYIYIYIYIYMVDSVKIGQFRILRLFGPVEETNCQNICSCCYIHPHHIALAGFVYLTSKIKDRHG